ncbi:S1 RNA-binding domain-containing protein [Candidatus Woesearchaeota archaeon]|nr:MAG: S1 RNA-binding domain-containing protein [Candidatus Woesearchaeota archaeon]
MLRKKQGFPEEGEVVLCTVTKIQYNSVFVNLDEYDKQGMIHISEIAPGRIRNIHDYVKEGKVVVCKVLRVNQERGHIDLSLRRVTETQRRLKVNELKQEQLAEKIVDFVAGKLKKDMKQLYNEIAKKIFDEQGYSSLYSAFEEVVNEDLSLASLGIDKKVASELEEVIRQRIKPPEVHINARMRVRSYEPDGVEHVKKVVSAAAKVDKEAVRINYLGGGSFGIDIKAPDYKTAEGIYSKIIKTAEKSCSSKLTTVDIQREKE